MNQDPTPTPPAGDPEPPPGSAAGDAQADRQWDALPLFPLQTVLFPGGLLPLKIFEARYLDLISHCLRHGTPFGVVCLDQGSEVQGAGAAPRLESVAVLAHLIEVDAEQAGILTVRCRGGQRVQLGRPQQRADGLWLAPAQARAGDPDAAVPAALEPTALALGQAIGSLAAQDQYPFLRPFRLDDAGWVANRWCEILPISDAAKVRLMALDDPVLRLSLVHEYLQGKGAL